MESNFESNVPYEKIAVQKYHDQFKVTKSAQVVCKMDILVCYCLFIICYAGIIKKKFRVIE